MREADERAEDEQRARLAKESTRHRERIRALLQSLAARVPSDRYFYR